SWGQDPVETEMIKAHPAIFPNFYAIPTVQLDRRYVKELMDFTTHLATWFRWLPVALLQDSDDLLSVFERWQRWRRERVPEEADENTGWTPYYSHRRFHREFLEFVQTCYLTEMARARAAVAAVACAEAARSPHKRTLIVNEVDALDGSSIPYRRDDVITIDVEVDYKAVIDCLKNGTDLSGAPPSDGIVVFSSGDDRFDVWQLPPHAASLLRLCDGRTTVKE